MVFIEMHIGLVDLLWEGHHTPYVVYLSQYFTEQRHQVTYFTDAEHPRLDELPDSDRLSVRALPFVKTAVDPGDGLVGTGRANSASTRRFAKPMLMCFIYCISTGRSYYPEYRRPSRGTLRFLPHWPPLGSGPIPFTPSRCLQ